MCGIVGIFKFAGDFSDEPELRALNQSMLHRGPDEGGIFMDGPAGLAMRRLSIIDLGGGHQPMESEDRNLVIIFNGECYNYREIRRELQDLGYRFRTDSDTEVVLAGYHRWGPAILDRLVGMWGLAIYDRIKREIFLARDRLGKKQLYFSIDWRRLVFGSELGVVMQARPENRLRPAALAEFLNYSYVGGGETAIEGVQLLREGHWARVCCDGTFESQAYWRVGAAPGQSCDPKDVPEEIYSRVVDAVRLRLVSDVPVSVMLSSGLDSSTIAYVLAKELNVQLESFSLGFGDLDFDEATDAGQFAAKMGMPWRRCDVTGDNVATDFAQLIRHGSSLQGNSAQIVYFYVNKLIRDAGFKVALNGSGGDELFAGYPTYRATKFFNLYRRVPHFMRSAVARLAQRLPASLGRVSLDYVAKKFTACPYDDPLKAHGYWRTVFSAQELDELLAPEFRAPDAECGIYEAAFAELGAQGADINTLLKADTKAWLIPMLPWVDNISMAHSVELRLPFLDHRLVDFAFGLPPDTLFRGWTLKRVMKQFLEPRLPAEVVYRKKRGTHVPLGRWLNGELRPLARHYLDAKVLNRHGQFNMAPVEKLLAEHATKRADHTFKLWNLITYSAWSETFHVGV